MLHDTSNKIRRGTDFFFDATSLRCDVLAFLRVVNIGLTEEAEFEDCVTAALYNNSQILF